MFFASAGAAVCSLTFSVPGGRLLREPNGGTYIRTVLDKIQPSLNLFGEMPKFRGEIPGAKRTVLHVANPFFWDPGHVFLVQFTWN